MYSSLSLARPEIVRYKQRLDNRYSAPQKAKILLLLPQTMKKPYHTSIEQQTVLQKIQETIPDEIDLIHVCTYAAPFGVVPTELNDVHPVSQNLIAHPFDSETITYVSQQTQNYITAANYNQVVLLREPKVWKGKVLSACKRACKKKQIPLKVLPESNTWNEKNVEHLVNVIKEAITSI